MSKETKQLIESPEVVVVEASAGSGKTYALAKRYVNILINSSLNKDYIPLRNILAITFTNKATLEMKARILELLKRIVFDDFENSAIANDIYSCFSLPKYQVRDKALAVMDKIVGHYSFFQVRTIDSFINNLLLGCALKIERSSKFRIERDCKENISYCLDWLIEQASANSEIFDLLEEFLEHYLFVENRKGWFPKEDILSLMVSLFQMSNKYGRLYHDYKGSSADLIKAKKKLFEKIRELSDPFCEGMNKIAQKSIKKFVDDDKPIFEIRAFPKSFLKDSPPLNKNVKCSLSYLDKWTRAHSLIREVVELESTISYNPYIKLFHRLLILFQDMAKQEDVLFLEELNRQARSLFDDDGMTVAEIYYRLAARFRHYLIDEFQDTSSLQWQNLFLMVEEALSSGGTLFYVGDKKQAIYRFRGGDVSLFDKIKDQFVHFNVKLKRLEKNWRSQKQIVEFNNKIFSKENLKEFLESSEIAEELNGSQTDIDEILEIFSDSSQEYKENNCNGYVYIERIEETNQKQRDDIVLDKVVSLIVELRDSRGLNYGEIAVLTRDNTEVETITAAFIQRLIPVESEKTLNVLLNHLIKELISFMKFLYSPIDDLSFVSFILGDIFSKATGLSNEILRNFVFEVHRGKKNKDGPFYRLFKSNFPDIWEDYLSIFFKKVGFVSVYELITAIYQKYNLLNDFHGYQAFFMKFLELIKSQENDFLGLDEFLAYLEKAPLEDLYVKVTSHNAVRVLTIHKSKGLEFGVVIIPFFRIDISADTGAKGTKSHVVDDQSRLLGLIRITKDYCGYSQNLNAIYLRDYKKACIDELNSLYVALTRAKDELYIYIPKRSAASKNKAAFLIPDSYKEFGEKKTFPSKSQPGSSSIITINEQAYSDWLSFLRLEFDSRFYLSERKNLLKGNIYHLFLSYIGNCYGKPLDSLINSAREFVQAKYPFSEEIADCERVVKTMLAADWLKEVFFVSQGTVYCEKEVANKFGEIKRIDRLIVGDASVKIIDYKSSKENPVEQTAQMVEYIRIVNQIYPDHDVCGQLLYLDSLKLETVRG